MRDLSEIMQVLRSDLYLLMLVIIFIWVGLWIHKALLVLFQIATVRLFDFEVRSFQFFLRKYTKGEDGRFTSARGKFILAPTVAYAPRSGEPISQAKDIVSSIVMFAVPGLFGLAVTVVFIMLKETVLGLPKVLIAILLGTVLGFFLSSVLMIGIMIVVLSMMTMKNLHVFTNQKIRELRVANNANDVDFPPLESLKDLKSMKMDRLAYQDVRFLWAEMRRDGPVMAEIAKWFRDYISLSDTDTFGSFGRELSVFEFMMFRNLVLYYSIWNIDPATARKYYTIASKKLDEDNDINGLRLRAYYSMNVLNDREQAQSLVNEGLNKPYDQRFPKLEFDHEVELLKELSDFISK